MSGAVHSMTGFATGTFSVPIGGTELAYKLEIKTLNHRFLDLKLRLPRDFAPFESLIKATVESHLGRGTVDLWIERVGNNRSENAVTLNEGLAEKVFESLNRLRERLGVQKPVELADVLAFPEVLSKAGAEERTPEQVETWRSALEEALGSVLSQLLRMRAEEGVRLKQALLGITVDLRAIHERLHLQRNVIRNRAGEKIRKRIEQCFEGYPSTDERIRALLETRIGQEISYALEKLDVEEELTRFRGHVQAIEELLNAGGRVGKKLDFLFQELNREINTLGNKSQDLEISREVIDLKMKVEQMREQSLNLE
jgi:uncharacterized protein (TIGR00255 family)